jgi:molybdate transport system substrate-binding protein
MSVLNILSGGAAQGLVGSLAPKFKALTGLNITGEFGAVGAMADKLRNGTPADIIILTTTLVARLAEEKRVVSASISDIGVVETALAVRSADPQVRVTDAATLRDAFLAADAIFVPDTKMSTAGIHVAKLLGKLGIANEVASRLKIFPNGATAMRHLAACDTARPLGCTQSTEIISTEGVVLSGSLPRECQLATVYTAAMTAQAAHTLQAQALIGLLVGADQQELRTRAGFLSVAT